MGMQLILLVMKFCIFFVASVVHGSAGYNQSPSPAISSASSPIEEKAPFHRYHRKSMRTSSHSPAPLPIESALRTPMVLPSHSSAPVPQAIQRLVPYIAPNTQIVLSPHESAPLSQASQGLAPSIRPIASHNRARDRKAPVIVLHAPVPVASVPRELPWMPPALHPTLPRVAPSMLTDPALSPISTTSPSISKKTYGITVAAPPNGKIDQLSPMNHSPIKGSFPVVAPTPLKAIWFSNYAPAPSKPPGRKWVHSPASSPLISFYEHHHARRRASIPALAPSYSFHPSTSYRQGPTIPPVPSNAPTVLPKQSRQRHHGPSPSSQGSSVSPIQSPFPSTRNQSSPAPSLSPAVPSGETKRPLLPPKISPSQLSSRKAKTPVPSPVHALPPPPPNQDCTSLTCMEPLTNTPPGSSCVCVWPMKVELRLSVALYTFFPLVSELAEELAAGVFLKQSQVRIMGANADEEQPGKTIVLIDLVPLGEKFDSTTALLTFKKFWHKQVPIKTSFFGDYEVLYVRYPGLPPSPPLAPSSISTIDDGPYTGQGNNGRTIKPLGVNIRRRRKDGLGGSMIAIIVLSSFIAVFLCIGAAWFLLLKRGDHVRQPEPTPQGLVPSLAKPSGAAGSMMLGNVPSSASLSFSSSVATYTGSAKTFSASEIERATDNFDASRIIGEGGFGRVYSGILDDGTKVAVKVLKRDDQQGGREFLAEVEMLSRLHHRNLVKLIGICTEDHNRCLVYELIPNGSVESHLHGTDKETAPLDWGARMKIALGAARGLAYLHEDSSPRVIHRDFKSSNILLEHDFNPKVSDFGLARTALDEESRHISTRVMGTFGYVAPEYAMTGHLLVKSDVYSYGVVLLELLTGRKPVDMSQPQGQENLVAWARPLLTSKEGLEMIIDSALGANFPFDSLAKVAAIASMCVQPEVSHRPFMGEVVQALKLVSNECDETKEAESGVSQEDLSIDMDTRISSSPGHLPEPSHTHGSMPDFDFSLETGRVLSTDIFSASARIGRQTSGSFRRYSSSGPLRTGRSRQLWQRLRDLTRGSISEHAVTFRSWAHHDELT